MKERPAYEGPVDEGSRRLAIVAVVVLGAIIVIITIVMAFSTSNTAISVDGEKATYSKNLSDD